jgi:hypothetical protein
MELIHTSVPAGLRPNSRGFCTVAMSRGLPPNLVDRLEALSGYRFWFDAVGPATAGNLPSHQHVLIRQGGRDWHVVSRIAPAPADYSGRSNKIAHHIIVDPADQPAAGPAWLLGVPALFADRWTDEPRLLERPPVIPQSDMPSTPCSTWARACGDARWAGELLRHWRDRTRTTVFVVVPQGINPLELVREALSLLPPSERWQATFNTWFGSSDVPADVVCQVRFIPAVPDAVRLARTAANCTIIDLTAATAAPATMFAEAAAAGRMLEPLAHTPVVSTPRRVETTAPDKPAPSRTPPADEPTTFAIDTTPPPSQPVQSRVSQHASERVVAAPPATSRLLVPVAVGVAALAAGLAAGWLLRSPPAPVVTAAPPAAPADTAARERLQAQVTALEESLAQSRTQIAALKLDLERAAHAAPDLATLAPAVPDEFSPPPALHGSTPPPAANATPTSVTFNRVDSSTFQQSGDSRMRALEFDPTKSNVGGSTSPLCVLPADWKLGSTVEIAMISGNEFEFAEPARAATTTPAGDELVVRSVDKSGVKRPIGRLRLAVVNGAAVLSLEPDGKSSFDVTRFLGMTVVLRDADGKSLRVNIDRSIDVHVEMSPTDEGWSAGISEPLARRLRDADLAHWTRVSGPERNGLPQKSWKQAIPVVAADAAEANKDANGELVLSLSDEQSSGKTFTLTLNIHTPNAAADLPRETLDQVTKKLNSMLDLMAARIKEFEAAKDAAKDAKPPVHTPPPEMAISWKDDVEGIVKSLSEATLRQTLRQQATTLFRANTLSLNDKDTTTKLILHFPVTQPHVPATPPP